MSYESLYRKYRSQTFDEVSGQDHVTRTLRNALRSQKVSHAYLFCGPRGTGKTTTARLLAKALNCGKGEAGPCVAHTPDECDACEQIRKGSFLDLKEIDAASNRGIDEMRSLRENVHYAPTRGRFTVYVIDEVHQLTPESFNAFLKTLEEPPKHAIFVLATTESHKIPATIVSRCQRFEFRRATLDQLKDRIRFVAEKEGAQVDDAALDLIAREANGGWRDALSLLEQVLAFCGGHATARDVYTVLGTVEADTLHALAESVRQADGAAVFRVLDDLVCAGKDPRQLLRDLTQHYRTLMLTAAGSAPAGDAEAAARIAEQARLYGQSRLIGAIEVLAQAEREARWSEQPRLLIELALARLMLPREAAAPVRAARTAAGVGEKRTEPDKTGHAGGLRTPEARPKPQPARPAPQPESPFVDGPAAASPTSNGPVAARSAAPAFSPDTQLPPPPLTVGDARTGDKDDDDLLEAFSTPLPPQDALPEPPPARVPEPSPAPKAADAPAPAAAAPAGGHDIDLLQRKWRLIGEELKRDRKVQVQACLVDTQPARFDGDTLVIHFASKTMHDLFNGKNYSVPLVQAIERVTGVTCRVRAETGPAGVRGAPQPGRAQARASAEAVRPPQVRPVVAPPPAAKAPAPAAPAGNSSELVHDVLEVFDGQIVEGREIDG